ncbi:MAG: DNA translocase FtsK 4TM domain-containing protein [Candidatus Moraniibacteriota bacterium]
MPRKKKKKKKHEFEEENDGNISSLSQRWLIAVIVWGVAAVTILSLIGKAGVVGIYFEQLLAEILGWGKLIIPLVLVLSGYWIVRQGKLAHPYYRINGIFLSFISLLAFSSLLANGQGEKIKINLMKGAGGYIGLVIAYLASYLGYWGGLTIITTAFVAGLILLLDGVFSKIEQEEKDALREEEKKELLLAELGEDKTDNAEQELLGIEPEGNWKNSLYGTLRGFKSRVLPSKRDAALKELEKGAEGEESANASGKENENEKAGIKSIFSSRKVNGVSHPEKRTGDRKIPGLNEDWKFPPLNILEKNTTKAVAEDIKTNSAAIKKTLLNFGIPAEVVEVNVGPTVTQYAIRPAEGIKLSRITAIQSNLAMSLAAHPIRIEAPIPGRALVGVEVPNKVKRIVSLRDLLEDPAFKESSEKMMITLGEDPAGNYVYADLAEMPHLLIAGATGSGKSIGINCIITGLLYRNTPRELKMIMVDPKRVELSMYNNIPHLLTPVIVDHSKVVNALKWAVSEMERRYIVIQETMSRNILSYNEKVVDGEIEPEVNQETGEILEPEFLPYIVIVIDELADLMSSSYSKEVEACIVRLAQMSRAVGIHLVLSTQRPSVNVITGIIKANFPTRVAFQVVSQIDSRTILDMAGAEKLLGKGDMLYMPKESNQPRRIQGALITDKEVQKMVDYLLDQEVADYNPIVVQPAVAGGQEGLDIGDSGADDELYEEAKNIVSKEKRASTSLLQRHLRIGYSRAARIMDILEANGVIGSAEGSKPRRVLAGTSAVDASEIKYDNPTEDQVQRDNWQA